MPVHVSLCATLRTAAASSELWLAAPDVGALLAALRAQFSDNAPFLRALATSQVILNGTNVAHLKGKRTPLCDGDRIVLFPPVGGG